jgi:uncharacterized membrane protein
MAAILLIAVGIFIIGAVAGVLWVLRLGADREGPFLAEAGPDTLTRGVRRVTGLYVKNDEYPADAYEDMLV